MKKILFLLLLFLPVFVSAQVLVYDKTEDGFHTLKTGYMNIYQTKDGHGASISLAVSQKLDKTTTVYSLEVTLNEELMTIEAGRKLLIKLADDSVIELENNNPIGSIDYTFKVNEFGRTLYFVAPAYYITEEQINKILSNTVVKIRVENDTTVIDREIKKNKFGKAMAEVYKTAQKGLAKPTSVYDGF